MWLGGRAQYSPPITLPKSQWYVFAEIEKSMLKFIWNLKRHQIIKTIFKKNKVRSITLPVFKTYYKASIIKTLYYWHEAKYIDQCNRVESPEINPCIYGQIIFNKDAKTTQWGRAVFSTVMLGNWIATCKIMKLDSYLTLYTK